MCGIDTAFSFPFRLRNLPKVLVKELTDILNCRPLLTIGKIMLGHNPWSCDCELLHFKRFIGVKGQVRRKNFLTKLNIQAHMLPFCKSNNILLTQNIYNI